MRPEALPRLRVSPRNRFPRRTPLLLLTMLGLAACGDQAPRDTATTGEPTDTTSPPAGDPGAHDAVPRTHDDAVAIAITIDDLPWVGPLPPGWDRLDGTARIMAALDAHDAHATGFVNCGRVASGTPVLERWLAAGHRLGNHTSQHLDLNQAAPDAWAEDARECDAFLRELTGEASLAFRYPYLHRGPTAERYRAGRDALDALGSTIAPVTIDTGDWILDDAYVAAVHTGDDARAETIAGAYVEHVTRAARHYRDLARERVGRDVAHILLLHANALLADRLDALLTRLEREGFHFVPLRAALEDPVYALEDDYIGPLGMSWLYRIAPATPGGHEWDDAEAAVLREVISSERP